MIALIFLAGCISWTLVEYGMHHWNGHLLKGRTKFSREHLKHHIEKDYFASTREKIEAAVPISVTILLVSGLAFGWVTGLIFSSGVITGYIVYEYLHWANHMRAPTGAYGRWARQHHFSHHFTDARYNHGVTTPVWDYVFGTYRAPKVIRIPEKYAMRWLLDDDGRLRPEYAEDYELIRPKRRQAA